MSASGLSGPLVYQIALIFFTFYVLNASKQILDLLRLDSCKKTFSKKVSGFKS